MLLGMFLCDDPVCGLERPLTPITDRATKFTNVTSVTLFISSNQGADSTRLYYIGFLGHWTQVRTGILLLMYIF